MTDPAYFAKMSALLDEIIVMRKARALEFQEYLKRIAELVKHVTTGQSDDTPRELDTPGRRALFHNLGQDKDLALRVDEAIRKVRPDAWRGVQAREQIIKRALFEVLGNVADVERIFLVVKEQLEY